MAQAACDVLQLLVSHWEKLQMFETSLPLKIAEVSLFTAMLKYKPFIFLFDISLIIDTQIIVRELTVELPYESFILKLNCTGSQL